MSFDRGMRGLALGVMLLTAGAVAMAAWQHALWGTVAGCALVAAWLLALLQFSVVPPFATSGRSSPVALEDEDIPLRVLLDQIPIPLVAVDAEAARALNRTARTLFATDERILPAPCALSGDVGSHLVHEGRRFRIDRVAAGTVAKQRAIMALIDVEAEERTAQARATADMIQVLGHELLNGLAPIVSLAESGLTVIAGAKGDDELLTEILGTLARRAEGLLRFTEAYRSMARFPDPTPTLVDPAALASDLCRLFESRWGSEITLGTRIEMHGPVLVDRDQITQAIWSLMQNAGEAAVKAGDSASVDLAIHYEAGRFRVTVTDSGNGVDPIDTDRIFRLFHTTKPAGTGVGLALARHIAHAHGGNVTLAAHSPTTFQLELLCRGIG